MIQNIFALIQAGILVTCVALAGTSLRDSRLLRQHPFLNSRLIKSSIGVFASANLALLLRVGPEWLAWLVFDLSALVTLVFLYLMYRRRFATLEIEFVDSTELLQLRSDTYTKIAPGVHVRLYRYDRKCVVPWEKELIEIAHDHYPETDFLALFFMTASGVDFGDHIHPTPEFTHLVKGRTIIFDDNRVYIAGDHAHVPPNTPHNFKSLEACRGGSFIGL